MLFRSDKGFRFRASATSRTTVYSAIFLGSNNHLTYSQDATTDINAKYVKDAVLRKLVPSRGLKSKI